MTFQPPNPTLPQQFLAVKGEAMGEARQTRQMVGSAAMNGVTKPNDVISQVIEMAQFVGDAGDAMTRCDAIFLIDPLYARAPARGDPSI